MNNSIKLIGLLALLFILLVSAFYIHHSNQPDWGWFLVGGILLGVKFASLATDDDEEEEEDDDFDEEEDEWECTCPHCECDCDNCRY